jgi:hypothetical protein
MITIRGIHKVMGMEIGEGWRISHISETPKNYEFDIIREQRVWNPNTFTPDIREEEISILLDREWGFLIGPFGFKYPLSNAGLSKIDTFCEALHMTVKGMDLIP